MSSHHRAFQIHAPKGLWPLTWPMGLTMLRMFLLPVFLYVLLADAGAPRVRPHRWWAMAIFAVMAITDKLDGYLARRLHQTSQLGTFLDPVADKLLISCSTILLSFSWVASEGYAIPKLVVVAIYGKDLFVAAGAVALLSLIGTVTVHPRPLGKLSTVLQLSLIIATLIAPDLDRAHLGFAAALLRFLWWTVSAVATLSCADYLWQGWRQFRHRPVPPMRPG
jgi:CDP-diacylglycerol--glycerol-3-phosphate 3-phosphatidyltransferase